MFSGGKKQHRTVMGETRSIMWNTSLVLFYFDKNFHFWHISFAVQKQSWKTEITHLIIHTEYGGNSKKKKIKKKKKTEGKNGANVFKNNLN